MSQSNEQPKRPFEKRLRYFEINEHGTIYDPSVTKPERNRDVFSGVSAHRIETLLDLTSEIENCYPLARHFAERANERAEELAADIEEEGGGSRKQRRQIELIERMRCEPEYDDGWHAWIESSSVKELPVFKRLIDAWLDESVNWDLYEFFDRGWSPQDAAMNFFQTEDRDIVEALDVVIVEGDHPGSSYCAAELRQDLAMANAVAERLNLDYRFRAR